MSQIKCLSKLIKASSISAVLLGTTVIGHAEPTGYNQLTFSADAKLEVENDQLTASMSKKVQADDPKILANQLTITLNQAMQIAKQYPSVEVATGSQRTYPIYDDDYKITGWTGQSSLEIKTTDIDSASRLIADLQELLVMDNLRFGISEKKQDILNKQLMTQASKAFQEQANSLASTWGASSYRVIAVNLNSGGNYYPQPVMIMAASSMSPEHRSVPTQDFESGNSTLSATASGTIELVK